MQRPKCITLFYAVKGKTIWQHHHENNVIVTFAVEMPQAEERCFKNIDKAIAIETPKQRNLIKVKQQVLSL